MSDNNGNDNKYWDDMYYFENYEKEMDPNSWSGRPRSNAGGGFWVWLIIFIIACNISSSLGSAILVIGIILLIICKICK